MYTLTKPLYSEFGRELTWVPINNKHFSTYWNKVESMERLLKNRYIEFYNCYRDGYAVELATKSFKNINDYYDYRTDVMRVASKLRLIPRDDVTIGGGCHIHFNLVPTTNDLFTNQENDVESRFYRLFVPNLFKDLCNRPYLNWIFNDYANVQSAESYLITTLKDSPYGEPDLIDTLKLKRNNRIAFSSIAFSTGKGFCARLDNGGVRKPATIELRFFDSPLSNDEDFLQLNFVNSYMNYIHELTLAKKVIPLNLTYKKLRYLTHNNRAVGKFYELLEELNLNKSDYKYFVNTNFKKRNKLRLFTHYDLKKFKANVRY